MAQQVIVVKSPQPLWSRCCSCLVMIPVAFFGFWIISRISMNMSHDREKARNKVIVEWLPNPSALWRDPFPKYVPSERMTYYAVWVRLTNQTTEPLTVSASAFVLVADNGERYWAADSTSEYRPIGPFPYVELQPGRHTEGNIIVAVDSSVPISEHSTIDYVPPWDANCTVLVNKGLQQAK